MERIFIYGSDKDEWTNVLLKEIDCDQLPAYYGGTLTDSHGDPKCPHLVVDIKLAREKIKFKTIFLTHFKFNMGGRIPKHYYLSNNLPVPKEDMDSITLIAGVGGFKKLKFKVLIVNSILRYAHSTLII
jgi:hypothetical protein